jgi:hypothetical protein
MLRTKLNYYSRDVKSFRINQNDANAILVHRSRSLTVVSDRVRDRLLEIVPLVRFLVVFLAQSVFYE